MRRKMLTVSALCLSFMMAFGCGNEKPKEAAKSDIIQNNTNETGNAVSGDSAAETENRVELVTPESENQGNPDTTESVAEETVVIENHDNMYRSELTNEWIDESLRDQRPIAVMVDNELTALPHFGVNQCDIVYEIMNSTANKRITRLMCVMKDWEDITQLGSIRSVRTTNFMLAAEYNAIIIHDGGPFYINDYIARDYSAHISGGFARFSNGKATEFTEYVTYEDYTNPTTGKSYDGLKDRLAATRYSMTYDKFYPGKHFSFSDDAFLLSATNDVKTATDIDLPFPHNGSELFYNEETGTYDYYEYGNPHIDSLDNCVTTFKNVIVQCCSFVELDENGYLTYNVVGSGTQGYYITNGEAIEITWSKDSEASLTHFYNKQTGEEIVLNTGKTYITLVPSDSWSELVIK